MSGRSARRGSAPFQTTGARRPPQALAVTVVLLVRVFGGMEGATGAGRDTAEGGALGCSVDRLCDGAAAAGAGL